MSNNKFSFALSSYRLALSVHITACVFIICPSSYLPTSLRITFLSVQQTQTTSLIFDIRHSQFPFFVLFSAFLSFRRALKMKVEAGRGGRALYCVSERTRSHLGMPNLLKGPNHMSVLALRVCMSVLPNVSH